jgi:hypothetical protein
LNGYTYHRCRCDECAAAVAAEARARNGRRRLRLKLGELPKDHPHGTTNGYNFYGCRCEECSDAMAAANSRGDSRREYYQENKAYLDSYKRRYLRRMKDIPGPNNWLPWTPADDAVVLDRNLLRVEKCYLLGRSYGAVEGRINKLGRGGLAG